MCHKWQPYDVLLLRYGVSSTGFFVILDHFLHFYPPKNPKNQNFDKMKETTGDIIVLHMCTINDNPMMYGSWDMECGIWHCGVMVITTAQLHSTKPKLRFCTGSNPAQGVSEIRNGEDLWQWSRLEIRLNAFRWSTIPQKQFIIIIIMEITFCHFGQFFGLLPLKNQKNQNFEKMKKPSGDIIILCKCTRKSWSYAILLLRYGMWGIVLVSTLNHYISRCYFHCASDSSCFTLLSRLKLFVIWGYPECPMIHEVGQNTKKY